METKKYTLAQVQRRAKKNGQSTANRSVSKSSGADRSNNQKRKAIKIIAPIAPLDPVNHNASCSSTGSGSGHHDL